MPKKIIFVGGNEKQARITSALQGSKDLRGLEVTFHHPCFSCNWNKTLERVKREIPGADAIVITTDVPTLLGKKLREVARAAGIPHPSVRARGRSGIVAALREAEAETLVGYRANVRSQGGGDGMARGKRGTGYVRGARAATSEDA